MKNDANEPNADVVVMRTVMLIDNGRIFSQLGEPTKALACFDKAVEICRPLSTHSDPVALSLSQALDNKANILVDLKRVAEAIPVYEEAIQVLEDNRRGEGQPAELREMAISVTRQSLNPPSLAPRGFRAAFALHE